MANNDLNQEIKDFLPGVTENQIKDFVQLTNKLESLRAFSLEFPGDFQAYKDSLIRAGKVLNYKEPYRISVIGTTGAGKSTLINAMLGRDLVLMKDIGKPATGAALQIFQDVLADGQENALVSYRDETDIYNLIREFVSRYNVQGLDLSSSISSNMVTDLSNLQPPSSLTTDRAISEFKALASSLSDLVQQFLNNRGISLDTEFLLSEETSSNELNSLIDENSVINESNSSGRRIGLVKSVTYHIKPDNSSPQIKTLKLPKNVCLVDLPGLDGTPLHDIIIGEGVREADAVVFILRPPRILGQGDAYLLRRVRDHLGLANNSASNERVFIILNARDSIMQDQGSTPQNLPRDMQEFIETLSSTYATDPALANRGGENPYFMTSAWAAYTAQKRIKGGVNLHDETYEATKIKLGVRDGDDFTVLEASQVPKLVKNITDFARESRIDGQLREGKLILEGIINQLHDSYESRKSQLTEDRGEYYFREKLYKKLEEQKNKLQKDIIHLRREILKPEQFEQQQKILARQAKTICDEVDKQLLDKMPELWKEHFTEGLDRLTLEARGVALYEPLLTEAQIFIWKQLNILLSGLGETLVKSYQNHLQTYKMTQRIFSGTYEFIDASEIELILDIAIDKMRKTVFGVSNRIAMIRMTDPDTYFTQLNKDNKPTKIEIAKSIKQLPNKQELPSGSFKELVTAIRKDYEEFVVTFCVRGLLNLYRFELILVEDKLCNKVREIFEAMRDQDEKVLRLNLQGESGDPEWAEAITLQHKLDKLMAIEP